MNLNNFKMALQRNYLVDYVDKYSWSYYIRKLMIWDFNKTCIFILVLLASFIYFCCRDYRSLLIS